MKVGQTLGAALGIIAFVLALGSILEAPFLSLFPPPDYPGDARCGQGSIIGSEADALLAYRAYVRKRYPAPSQEWMLGDAGDNIHLSAGNRFDLGSRQWKWKWTVGNFRIQDPKGRVVDATLDVCGSVELIEVLT